MSPDNHDHADVVRRLYEQAINEHRVELFAEMIAADYVGPRGERGPEGFIGNVEQLRAGIQDLCFTVEEIVAQGDRVAVSWTWSGHHTGRLFGVPATGKRITNSGIALYRFREGQVVSASLQVDRLGVLQQLGVVPL